MESIQEAPAAISVNEHVVLSKFEGEALPENEFERLTVDNGLVISHDVIENGEVVGPVPNSEILGVNIGTLMAEQPAEEVN